MSVSQKEIDEAIKAVRNGEGDEKYKEVRRKLKVQMDKLDADKKKAERKDRTHRLIQVGAVVEGAIGKKFSTEEERKELSESIKSGLQAEEIAKIVEEELGIKVKTEEDKEKLRVLLMAGMQADGIFPKGIKKTDLSRFHEILMLGVKEYKKRRAEEKKKKLEEQKEESNNDNPSGIVGFYKVR